MATNSYIRLVSNDGTVDKRFRALMGSYQELGMRKQTVQETASGKVDIQHGGHYRAWQMVMRVKFEESNSDTGILHAGGTATVTLDHSTAATIDDIYNTQTISFNSGTGSGQTAIILDYVGSTRVATLKTAVSSTTDNTTQYSISSLYGTLADLETFFDKRTPPGDQITFVDFLGTSRVVYIIGDWEVEPMTPMLDGTESFYAVPIQMRETTAK